MRAEPEEPAAFVSRGPALALWLALAAGVAVRLRQFLHARPLWLDEAMLSNNILSRNFLQLLHPLETNQSAPVPFLWAVKFATVAGGGGERALRLVPLLAGLSLLAAFAALARRLLPPWPAALAVLMVAVSPHLIYYSNEVKPYGLDACLTVILLLLAVVLRQRPEATGRWLALAVAGAVAAVVMTPAPFVLAGIGLALPMDPAVRQVRRALPRLFAMGVAWAGLFLAVYLAVYQAATQKPYMRQFWMPWFLIDSPPGILEKLHHLGGDALMFFFMAEGGLWRWEAAFLLVIPIGLGAVALNRRWGRWLSVMLLLPLALAVLASTLRLYPLASRLLLFTAPSLVLLAVAGAVAAAEWLSARWRLPWAAAAALVLTILPILDVIRQVRDPYEREAVAPLVRTVLAQHAPGAAVYVHGRTVPAWIYYTTDWRNPDLVRVNHLAHLVGSDGAAFSYAPPRGQPVGEEGDSLIFEWGDWRELVGIPGGRGPDSLGVTRPIWDPGWAANEVRRIRAAGRNEAWVVYTSVKWGIPDPLDSAMTAAGARIALRQETKGAILTRWEWSGE